jgi:alpha-beta hydrolase superfamily lysophospholipase
MVLMRARIPMAVVSVLCALVCAGCEKLVDDRFHTQSDDGVVPLPAGLNPVALQIPSGDRVLDAHYVPAEHPAGPLILLFHGNGENVADWGRAQALLRQHGLSSLVFDYSGFGRSTGRATIDHFHEDALAAYARARALAMPGQGVAVIAHSLGTYVALDAEPMMVPPPTRLVLWGVFAGLRRDVAWKGGIGWIESRLIPDRWDNIMEIPAVTAPTLILHGDLDTVVPGAETDALVRAGGWRVTYRAMPGADHNALYKTANDAVWQPILDFVGAPAPAH